MKATQREKIIQWGHDRLLSLGYQLETEKPDEIQNTDWSDVLRYKTSDGFIYLKHTPEALAIEANITQALYDQFSATVPEIIASNTDLNCFLMKDAGEPLRKMLKTQFNSRLLCNAITQFTSLQIDLAEHIDVFTHMGVPDWRLAHLPNLYDQFVLQKDLLRTDGLSESDIRKLILVSPEISKLCDSLIADGIPQSIVQCDFHDNNILIDKHSGEITFIDLGEVVISHPFFSLVGCLWQAKKNYGLKDGDEAYRLLYDACLNNFKIFNTHDRLKKAFTEASVLWQVFDVLAQYRLMLACGREVILSYQPGKLAASLRRLIKAFD